MAAVKAFESASVGLIETHSMSYAEGQSVDNAAKKVPQPPIASIPFGTSVVILPQPAAIGNKREEHESEGTSQENGCDPEDIKGNTDERQETQNDAHLTNGTEAPKILHSELLDTSIASV
jgi:hypothetical protein